MHRLIIYLAAKTEVIHEDGTWNSMSLWFYDYVKPLTYIKYEVCKPV